MLTFSEALTQIKAGEDLRHSDWPSTHFVRAAPGSPGAGSAWVLRKLPANAIYTPTQAEIFSQNWSRA